MSASAGEAAAAQMNDPKTVRKAVKTKAEKRERESEQTERTICLPLFDSNRPSVRPSDSRKISGEEKEREREGEEGRGSRKRRSATSMMVG